MFSVIFTSLALFSAQLCPLVEVPTPPDAATLDNNPTTPAGRLLIPIDAIDQQQQQPSFSKAYNDAFFELLEESFTTTQDAGSNEDDDSFSEDVRHADEQSAVSQPRMPTPMPPPAEPMPPTLPPKPMSPPPQLAKSKIMVDNDGERNTYSCHDEDLACLAQKLTTGILRRFIRFIGDLIMTILNGICDIIKFIIMLVWAAFKALVLGTITFIYNVTAAFFQGIWSLIKFVIGYIWAFICSAAKALFEGTCSIAKTTGQTLLDGSIQTVAKTATAFKDGAASTVTAAFGFCSSAFRRANHDDSEPVQTHQIEFNLTYNSESMKCTWIRSTYRNDTWRCSYDVIDCEPYKTVHDEETADWTSSRWVTVLLRLFFCFSAVWGYLYVQYLQAQHRILQRANQPKPKPGWDPSAEARSTSAVKPQPRPVQPQPRPSRVIQQQEPARTHRIIRPLPTPEPISEPYQQPERREYYSRMPDNRYVPLPPRFW